MADETDRTPAAFGSGFVTFVGRPNVGKSSLVNAICGRKISIVSDKPQTTRHRIMGVLTRPDSQLVFVDTPGLHKPVTALGQRVNATALESVGDVDVTCLVLDATAPFGKGDRWVADHLDMPSSVVIVNKPDIASREQVLRMLTAAGELGAAAYFPVSARSGEGIGALVADLEGLRRHRSRFEQMAARLQRQMHHLRDYLYSLENGYLYAHRANEVPQGSVYYPVIFPQRYTSPSGGYPVPNDDYALRSRACATLDAGALETMLDSWHRGAPSTAHGASPGLDSRVAVADGGTNDRQRDYGDSAGDPPRYST